MKRNIFILGLMVLTLTYTKSQDVEKILDDAKTAYQLGKMEDARFALQQALNEIDAIIGKKILEILPKIMKDMPANDKSDQVTGGGSGYVGLFVIRTYGIQESEKKVSLEIISDSPLLTGINTILAMPQIAGLSDPNQKRIKIDGYKALMQKNVNENDATVSYIVQIPFGNSLITLNCYGIPEENDIVNMVSTIPVGKIAELAK